jgi:hypothetical protein
LKFIGYLLTLAIFAFWASMNTKVILRQQEIETQDRYRASVTRYLGNELLRERWLGVYRKNKKIGYTGETYEKVLAAEGFEIHATIESRMEIDFFGKSLPVSTHGFLVLDARLRPMSLRVDIDAGGVFAISVRGESKGGEFALVVERGGTPVLRIPVPRGEMLVGNGLVPALPISGFRVGDEFRVPCFDPIRMERSLVEVKVASHRVKEIDGLLTEVFSLETRFREFTSKSWVTATGELLRQEFGPPLEDIILRRESRDNARRYFKK